MQGTVIMFNDEDPGKDILVYVLGAERVISNKDHSKIHFLPNINVTNIDVTDHTDDVKMQDADVVDTITKIKLLKLS